MSSNIPHIGAFESVYLCLTGVASSFTQISATTTEKNTFSATTPRVYNYATKQYIQGGSISVKVHLSFLSDDPVVSRIANGNWTNTAFIDAPSEFNQYGLLCIHPDYDSESSLYVPCCGTQTALSEFFSKSEVTTQDLDFEYLALSIHADPVTGLQPYYKRTVAGLATVIGAYFPVPL